MRKYKCYFTQNDDNYNNPLIIEIESDAGLSDDDVDDIAYDKLAEVLEDYTISMKNNKGWCLDDVIEERA